jgi:hypothetical protein
LGGGPSDTISSEGLKSVVQECVVETENKGIYAKPHIGWTDHSPTVDAHRVSATVCCRTITNSSHTACACILYITNRRLDTDTADHAISGNHRRSNSSFYPAY